MKQETKHTIEHVTEKRPWGNFVRFTHNVPSTVKIITIEAGARLSLQYHMHRQEFWRILEGNPTIIIDGKVRQASAGDEFTIPPKAPHRITAPAHARVVFLEIATGDFDEKDIVRVEDDYGRSA